MAGALLDAAVSWAAERGRAALVLEVTATNTRAARFYSRYGFALSDDPVITEGGTSMRLSLAAKQSTVD